MTSKLAKDVLLRNAMVNVQRGDVVAPPPPPPPTRKKAVSRRPDNVMRGRRVERGFGVSAIFWFCVIALLLFNFLELYSGYVDKVIDWAIHPESHGVNSMHAIQHTFCPYIPRGNPHTLALRDDCDDLNRQGSLLNRNLIQNEQHMREMVKSARIVTAISDCALVDLEKVDSAWKRSKDMVEAIIELEASIQQLIRDIEDEIDGVRRKITEERRGDWWSTFPGMVVPDIVLRALGKDSDELKAREKASQAGLKIIGEVTDSLEGVAASLSELGQKWRSFMEAGRELEDNIVYFRNLRALSTTTSEVVEYGVEEASYCTDADIKALRWKAEAVVHGKL